MKPTCLTVPCPTCGAKAGQACQWGDITYFHRSEHAARRKAFNLSEKTKP